MAWDSSELFGPHRWEHFSYFKSWTMDETLEESIAPGKPWKLCEVRIHMSIAMASNKYFQMIVSAAKGSAYNTILYSLNYTGSTDIFLHYSDPLLFLSDDQLNLFASMVSVTNVHGIEVIGWAVIN